MKIRKIFGASAVFGAILLFATFLILASDDSPYRYGRLGGLWSMVQCASAVLFLYAGAMGGWVVLPGVDHRAMRPWVGILSIVFVMMLVLASTVMTFLNTTPTVPPTRTDLIAVWIAKGCTTLSLLVAALAVYYNYWVLCFQRRMRTQRR